MQGSIDINNLAGLKGGNYIDDTNEHTTTGPDSWFALKALGGDAVVSTSSNNIDGLDGFTITQDDVIVGNFTAITLSSGAVIAYKR